MFCGAGRRSTLRPFVAVVRRVGLERALSVGAPPSARDVLRRLGPEPGGPAAGRAPSLQVWRLRRQAHREDARRQGRRRAGLRVGQGGLRVCRRGPRHPSTLPEAGASSLKAPGAGVAPRSRRRATGVAASCSLPPYPSSQPAGRSRESFLPSSRRPGRIW